MVQPYRANPDASARMLCKKEYAIKVSEKSTLVATDYTGASSSIHSLTASYCYGLIHTTLDSSSA